MGSMIQVGGHRLFCTSAFSRADAEQVKEIIPDFMIRLSSSLLLQHGYLTPEDMASVEEEQMADIRTYRWSDVAWYYLMDATRMVGFGYTGKERGRLVMGVGVRPELRGGGLSRVISKQMVLDEPNCSNIYPAARIGRNALDRETAEGRCF